MRTIFLIVLLLSPLCFNVVYTSILLVHNIPIDNELDRLNKISDDLTKNGFNLSYEDQQKFDQNTDEFIKVDKQWWYYGYPFDHIYCANFGTIGDTHFSCIIR